MAILPSKESKRYLLNLEDMPDNLRGPNEGTLHIQSQKCYTGASDTADNFGSTFHVTCNYLNNILIEKS